MLDQDFENKQGEGRCGHYFERHFKNQHSVNTQSKIFLEYSKLATEFIFEWVSVLYPNSLFYIHPTFESRATHSEISRLEQA